MDKRYTIFSHKIERILDASKMGLPHRSATSSFRLHNHDYEPIRASWQEVRELLEIEGALLKRLKGASDFAVEYDLVSDEIYNDENQPFQGLDLGVASAVLALSALKCVTIYSCNGGCFGDFHHAEHPMIVFHAKTTAADLLLDAANISGVGLCHSDSGLMVWANDIGHLHRFAEILAERNIR